MTTISPALRRSESPRLVLVLTGLFVAVMSAITALVIWQSYHDIINRTQARAEAAAHIVSVHAQWLIDGSSQALRRIDRELGPQATSLVGLGPEVRAELAGLPAEVLLGVYDATGQSIEGDPPQVPRNVADTEYFAALRNGTEWTVSSLLPSTAGADPQFAIARRITRNGAFAGIDVIFVSAKAMETFWASLNNGPGSTVSLVRTDGWLIARYPVSPAPLDLSGHVLLTTHYKAAENGTYSAQSPADGVIRIVGYRKVDDLPVIAMAAISTEQALSQFWTGVSTLLALLLPVLAALILGAIWLSRILKREDARRLQLAQVVEDNKTLMREIHHRVKNNLQAVSSLVQLQPIPAPSKAELARRISAMVSVHEHIYRSDQFTRPEVGQYIKTIIDNASNSSSLPVEIAYRLDKLHVDKDNAMPLGLIVSEVISNAFKHAFPDGRKGRIEVALRDIGDSKGELSISDNGQGFDPATDTRGMGRRLLEGLAAQLTGTFQYRIDNGTHFTLQFPTVPAEAE
ncbi:MAG TPA: histidine kinase dimerization/phosphoacceptor domain -containing protein [Devosia sp.]|nr:histidine kinase dimerization/phosphoacceptor domain -containing protein [Devosia sp.]